MEKFAPTHKVEQVNLTHHGLQRLQERLGDVPIDNAIKILQEAFILGKQPPRSFKRGLGGRPSKETKYRYCFHKGFIFVFYKFKNDKKQYPDFFLVTIYIWDDRREKVTTPYTII